MQEEKKNIDLRHHVQSFLQGGGNKVKRVKSRRGRDTDTDDCSDSDRRSRATTPGKALLEEVNLKPASERTIKNRLDAPKKDEKSELKNHFRDFMRTPATVKRGRSFSQPRDKDGKNSGKEETSLSRKESFNDKYTREGDQVKIELENHTKRFLQKRSLIKPMRQSDNDSDCDSFSAALSVHTGSNKTVDKDSRDSWSEEELENSSSVSNNNIISYKPPPLSAPLTKPVNQDLVNNNEESETCRETELVSSVSSHSNHQNNVRSSERVRSKSEIVPPQSYDIELNVEQMLEDSWGPRDQKTVKSESSAGTGKQSLVSENNTDLEGFNGQKKSDKTEQEADENYLLNNANTICSDRQRIRKYSVYSNNEYVYVDAKMKIGNSKPRPFTLSHGDNDKISISRQNSTESSCDKDYGNEANKTNSCQSEQLEKSYSKLYLGGEDKENGKKEKSHRSRDRRSESNDDPSTSSHNIAASFTAKTTEILNACKNDIKKLTYRKIYMRSKSDTKSKSVEKETEMENGFVNGESSSVYTKYSSGSRIPNRPTTPGPYLDRVTSSTTASSSVTSPYIPKRPTTPGPFARESWRKTNKKFNYTHINKYSNHETFV